MGGLAGEPHKARDREQCPHLGTVACAGHTWCLTLQGACPSLVGRVHPPPPLLFLEGRGPGFTQGEKWNSPRRNRKDGQLWRVEDSPAPLGGLWRGPG